MMLLRTSAGIAHPLFARTSACSEIPFLFAVGAFLCEIEGCFGRICSNVHQLAIKSSIQKLPIPLAYGSGRLHFIRVVTILQGRRFRKHINLAACIGNRQSRKEFRCQLVRRLKNIPLPIVAVLDCWHLLTRLFRNARSRTQEQGSLAKP
jgi:hypothetical protein